MNCESLKNVFGNEIAQKITVMLKQKDSVDWTTNLVSSLCEGFPENTSTQQFTQADNFNDDGWDWHTIGQYNKALDCYQQALKLCSSFPLVWNNKGLAHFLLGQFNNAKKAYETAITINPLFIRPYPNMGILYYELQSDHEEAKAWFLKALALDPNDQITNDCLSMINNGSKSSDVLMIGTDSNLAIGLIEEFKKQDKKTRWIR